MIVSKTVRLCIAGIAWIAVGAHLTHMGGSRLLTVAGAGRYVCYGFSILAMPLMYRFGFRKLVDRNVARIDAGPEKAFFFHFISLKSYLLIVCMIALGVFLRRSSVPEMFRAIIYLTMGLVLLISGIRYELTAYSRACSRK